MLKNEIKKYQVLNKLADLNGTVIFGGTEDREIPLCELKQAFELDSKLYNRSIAELSIENALEIYDACVAPLQPECILLHIGDADLKTFEENPQEFYVVCTDVITGKPVYKRLDKAEYNDLEWIRASASMPLASRIVEIDGYKNG